MTRIKTTPSFKEGVPLYQNVSQRIMNMLHTGELQQGQKLPPERVLAEKFGVSRSSVREAIRLLSQKGILRSRQGDGTYAKENGLGDSTDNRSFRALLAQQNIDDLMEFRLAMECSIAELATKRATEEDINSLKALLYDQLRAREQGEDETDIIAAFHLKLARMSRNALFMELMAHINAALDESRRSSGQDGSFKRKASRGGHYRIVTALENRNPENCRQEMHRHLETNMSGPGELQDNHDTELL